MLTCVSWIMSASLFMWTLCYSGRHWKWWICFHNKKPIFFNILSKHVELNLTTERKQEGGFERPSNVTNSPHIDSYFLSRSLGVCVNAFASQNPAMKSSPGREPLKHNPFQKSQELSRNWDLVQGNQRFTFVHIFILTLILVMFLFFLSSVISPLVSVNISAPDLK